MLRRFAPLRIKLPTMVALLLAACTGAVVVMAYRSVEASITLASADRLRSAADRVGALLTTSNRRSNADAQRIAALPALHEWLTTGTGDVAAQARLDSIVRVTPLVNTISLSRADGRQLVAGDARFAARPAPIGPGPFFIDRDTLRVSFAARLIVGSDTLGTYTIVRSVTGGANTPSDVLGGLVGQHVTLLIGNTDGGVWTDLTQAMPAPANTEVLRRALSQGRVVTSTIIASVVRVTGAPWLIWIEQPADVALTPATTLVRRLATLAVIVVLIGALIAWWLIRRITEPLDDLATASDGMARGDYRRRVPRENAADEMGRLAAAFNAMANQVETHHRELEVQVAERTAALEDAMEELQRAQDEVVRTARLATLGQLAGGVGHELRNPLGVMTNAVFVLETVLPDPDPMVRDYFGILKAQIALSEKIVADLLDFARIKPAARSPNSLFSLVTHQVNRLGPLGKVRVEYDFPDALPAADIDGVQIGQVVLNLVANAVQAMGEAGGVLSCRARHDGNGTVLLEVADTGPGMTADVARRVFEPLFTTKARGLGLGLAVSRMLAQNNSGRLTFVTRLGIGTTFTLALPVAQRSS